MPEFKYNAVTLDGSAVEGTYVSSNKDDVAKMLRQKGYYATEITKSGQWNVQIGVSKMPIKVVARLCTQMSAMLRAGVSISRTLEILKIESEYKPLRVVLSDVYGSILAGNSLSAAFKPHEAAFPVFFNSMIAAGETSGTLDVCLQRAGESFTKAAKLNAKIQGAMIYPSIVLTVMGALIILLLTFVVPAFSEVYAQTGAELPAMTLFVLGISDFMVRNWLLMLIYTIVVVTGALVYFKSDYGRTRLDRFKMGAPITGKLASKIYASRFCRTLASLTSAGIALPEALGITARSVVNLFLEKNIRVMIEDVTDGMDLSVAMEKRGLFPLLVVSVTKLGEESGTLEEMLSQVANYYDDEAETAIQAMITLMEPLMIILMAVIVVPILLAALLPMFDMVNVL
jgi:type IV pilus assembly protein PilC